MSHNKIQTLCWSVTALALPLVASAADYGLGDAATAANYNKVPIEKILGGIINIAFSLLGFLFLGMMLYAGYNWMTAMGDDEKVNEGKSTLIWATIGMVVIIGAYAITTFVIANVYGIQ